MVVWDDLLPEYPADVADVDAAIVADALVSSYGGGLRSPADQGNFDRPDHNPRCPDHRTDTAKRPLVPPSAWIAATNEASGLACLR